MDDSAHSGEACVVQPRQIGRATILERHPVQRHRQGEAEELIVFFREAGERGDIAKRQTNGAAILVRFRIPRFAACQVLGVREETHGLLAGKLPVFGHLAFVRRPHHLVEELIAVLVTDEEATTSAVVVAVFATSIAALLAKAAM